MKNKYSVLKNVTLPLQRNIPKYLVKFNEWYASLSTYSQLSLRLPEANTLMVLVRAYKGAQCTDTHTALATVDTVDVLVLLALPGRNILHRSNQGVILEDWRFEVGAQVL